MSSPQKLDDDEAVFGNRPSADQPTTEPSARAVLAPWLGTGVSAADAVRALDDAGLLASAPQPAADTDTEVQWGVRYRGGHVVEESSEQRAHARVAALPRPGGHPRPGRR